MGYVYMIINTVNQKKYIGISIHEPEKRRIKAHLSGRGNRIIANAVKKYGKDAFTYEILEANVFDEFLPDLEVAYIAEFNTVAPHGYNLDSGGSHAIPSEETRRKLSRINKGENHHFFGKKHTADTRRKISEANKGEKNPNFGKPISAEQKRRISTANKGRKRSEEHKRKISAANKGRKYTEEHKRKISEANKGENHHFFGKKHTADTRRKISEAQKGKKCKPFSKEHRRKISEARMHPDHKTAREFFLSLPPDMPLMEKRKLLFTKFSNVHKRTIWKWVRKWTSP